MPQPTDPKKNQTKVELENAAEAAPERAPGMTESLVPVSPEATALAEQLAAVQAAKEELRETLIRRQADFENYRKRIERERFEDGQRVAGRLIEAVLPVLDAFERALAAHEDPSYEAYRKGFELIYRQLWDTLARLGLERIEVVGKPFDPHIHQAVERVETEAHADGIVLETLQAGYRLRGKVLRPAAVRVAVHPGEKEAEPRNRPN